jgi:hypothetical protein
VPRTCNFPRRQIIKNRNNNTQQQSNSNNFGLGSEAANFYTQIDTQVVIIMAMIGYLSAVIRAPLTSTFVVLEMTLTQQQSNSNNFGFGMGNKFFNQIKCCHRK